VTAAADSATLDTDLGNVSLFLETLSTVSTVLQADVAPLLSVPAFFSSLSRSLTSAFASVPWTSREFLIGRPIVHSEAFQRPLMVLALFLDPFWFDVGRSVDDLLLVDSTLPALRDQAVSFIAVPDPALSGRLSRDLSACLDQYSRPASVARDSPLHPTLRWNLHGEPFSSLQCVALRPFSVPSSAAAGERAFKKFKLILYSARYRTTNDRVNARTRVSVNFGQLGCANGVRNFWRSSVELTLLVQVGGVAPPGALAPDPAVGVQGLALDLPPSATAAAPDHPLVNETVDGGGNEAPEGGPDREKLGDLPPNGVDASVDGAPASVDE